MRVKAPKYKLFTQLRPGLKWHVTLDDVRVGWTEPRPNNLSTCTLWAPPPKGPDGQPQYWLGQWHGVSRTAELSEVCGNCTRMWELQPADEEGA